MTLQRTMTNLTNGIIQNAFITQVFEVVRLCLFSAIMMFQYCLYELIKYYQLIYVTNEFQIGFCLKELHILIMDRNVREKRDTLLSKKYSIVITKIK